MTFRDDPYAGRLPRLAVIGRSALDADIGVELVAACEADPAVIAGYAQMGVDTYTPEQMDQMLERDDIDIVAVKTPNFLHTEMTVKALDAGKHVWVEKPMGITHEELDRIIAARERSGREVQVDLELRNSALFVRVKEIIAEFKPVTTSEKYVEFMQDLVK